MMAENMIERIAAFLKDRDENVEPHEANDEERLASAHCIVEAMREPTGAMTAAGIKRQVGWDYGEGRGIDEYPHTSEQAVYTAMIDAALEEKP